MNILKTSADLLCALKPGTRITITRNFKRRNDRSAPPFVVHADLGKHSRHTGMPVWSFIAFSEVREFQATSYVPGSGGTGYTVTASTPSTPLAP
jgi:hypothetical protein